MKGREGNARNVLQKTLPNKNEVINEEIINIKQTLESSENPTCTEELKLFLKWSFLKRYTYYNSNSFSIYVTTQAYSWSNTPFISYSFWISSVVSLTAHYLIIGYYHISYTCM